MIRDIPLFDNQPLRADLWAGIKSELPIALGVLPFGMIYGVLGVAAGLTPLQTQAIGSWALRWRSPCT